MPSTRDKQEFLAAVCSQIRFKGVHKKIASELSDHIEDQTRDYITQGLDEQAAAQKALLQMGDPLEVGTQLDITHRPKPEWSILAIASVLIVLGTAVQYFLTQSNPRIYGSFSYVVLYMLFGLVIFCVTYFGGYTLLARFFKSFYSSLVSVAAFTACFFVLINGRMVNGRSPYIYYLALLYIPAYASIVYGLRKRGYWGIVLSGLAYAIPALLCLATPDFVAFMFLTLPCLIILTVTIAKGEFAVNKKAAFALVYGTGLLVLAAITLVVIAEDGYLFARLLSRVSALSDPNGAGYAFVQIRTAVANALPFGPSPQMEAASLFLVSDYSLTYILYRFGYVPAVAITALFAALVGRMLIAIRKIKNNQAFLVALSVCLALAVQIVFYVLSNFGVIAPVSATLPFLSFGASGFVTNMALLGLLLCVYRRKDLLSEADESRSRESKPQLVSFTEGKLIIDFALGAYKKTQLPK